jgi:hypothetical protein
MIADLANEWRVPGKARTALESVESRAARTAYETGVERRLARAYQMMNDPASAEKHYEIAERASSRATPLPERIAAFSEHAQFRAAQHDVRGAVELQRRLAQLPGLDDVHVVVFHLAAAEQALRLSDDTQHQVAAQELAAMDAAVANAHTHQLTPSDATIVSHAVAHASQLRARNHM